MKPITYTMKDITKMLNITETTVRNYEKKGLVSVERAENNYRQFTLKNLTKLVSIRKYHRIGCSLDMIKDLLSCRDAQSMTAILNVQKQKLQQQITDLQLSIQMIETDIRRAEMISHVVSDRTFIMMPDFRFYSVDELDIHHSTVKKNDISNYAFMYTPEDLYNNTPPHLGYIRKISDTPTDRLCLYKMYKVDKSIVGTEGTRTLHHEDLIYLKENGYEICDNVIAVKVFSMVDEDNDSVDYIEAYLPVRKTE